MNIEEVLEKYTEQNDECWLWSGAIGGNGSYGIFTEYISPGVTKTWAAHRYVYTHLIGPIGEESDLHHTCRIRRCVNPEHLKELTDNEHKQVHRNSTCGKGHVLDEENLYRHPVTGQIHGCKKCRREAFQRWKAKQKGISDVVAGES